MKILFIARTYPPLIGGMERFASDFYNYLGKCTGMDLLANPRGKAYILPFYFKCFFFLMFNARKYDIIHFNDATMAALIPAIRLFCRAKVTFTVHGLDILYEKFAYQRLIPSSLKKADRVFAVSRHARQLCLSKGIPPEKVTVIPNGINLELVEHNNPGEIKAVLDKFGIDPAGRKVLFSVGRLIKRKGFAWFLENVFPLLPEETVHIIAGRGPELPALMELAVRLGLEKRIHFPGYVTEQEKNCLYQAADLFIMPNITAKNDPEGFGIVILEAGIYGLPVIATGIEGIQDAVIEGVTGRLIPEMDAPAFAAAIMDPRIDREGIIPAVMERFDWNRIATLYQQEFERCCSILSSCSPRLCRIFPAGTGNFPASKYPTRIRRQALG